MRQLPLLLISATLLLAGCDSVSARVRERFATVPPKTRTVEADRRTTYAAVQLALKKIGCTLSRADISEGLVEGYRPIQTGASMRDARQITLKIRLREVEPGRTEVAVWLHELVTGDFPGGAMDQPLREHSLYDSYFVALEQVVKEKDALKNPARE